VLGLCLTLRVLELEGFLLTLPMKMPPVLRATQVFSWTHAIPGQCEKPSYSLRLWVDAVEGAGEGDGFADVFQAADPGYAAFDAHAETAVGDAAVFAEV